MSLKRQLEDRDLNEELDEKIKKLKAQSDSIKKHSLDSDEEDDDGEPGKTYEILADDDIEGQEDGVAGQDGEVKLTPFNMKEEMEEGHFDTEGNYHWNKEEEIKDHWLDNIDWVKLKKGEQSAAEGDENISQEDQPASPFDEKALYREMLSFMAPGETVAQSIKRLGGGSSLSASERLKRRKAGLPLDQKGDASKITLLTELANRLLTKTGNMDIYQESYTHIKNIIDPPDLQQDQELDMYADDFDEKERELRNKETLK